MAEQYNSNFTGPEIDAILGGAVRYDLAQSLTEAQQKQARKNIGADAVQGAVRYDQAQSLSSAQRALARSNIDAISRTAELCTDCNTTVKAGIYRIDGSTQNGPNYIKAGLGHLLIVLPWDQNTLVQIYYAPERALKFCRFSASGWKPWECVNPLLDLGGEYRTTERYLGKPVYVKLVNPVHAAMTSETAVDLVCYFGVSNIAAVVSCVPVTGEWKNGAIVSPINNVPFLHSIAASSNLRIVCTGMATNYVRYNFSGYDGDYGVMPLIKYTKTTD